MPQQLPLAAALLALALAAPAGAQVRQRHTLQPPMSLAPPSFAGALVQSSPTYPACGAALPSASCKIYLQYLGGRQLSNVKVYAVYWNTGVPADLQSGLGAFYKGVTDSPYLDWLYEYGTSTSAGIAQYPGRGVFAGAYTITPAGNTSKALNDSDFGAELDRQIGAGNLPPPDANTLYMLHFPPGYSITDASGYQSCVDYCAYHSTWSHGGSPASYGVIPDQTTALSATSSCASGCGKNATVLQNTTETAAHELMEAITDADVGLAVGSGCPPQLAWYDVGSASDCGKTSQGETGDMCNGDSDTITSDYDGATYTVQQIFSASAQLCVSRSTGTNDYSIYAANPYVTLAAGSSVAVPLATLTTSGSASSLKLAVTSAPPGVTGSFSASPVSSGTSLTLTLTAQATAPAAKDGLVVIRATSGAIVHSAALLVQVGGSVTPPSGFSLSVPSATTTLFPGSGFGSIKVSTASTATPLPTLSGFAVSGLPPGVTASFSPTSVTAGGSTTLTLSAAASAASGAGPSPITLTASSGGVTGQASGSAQVAVDGLPSVAISSPASGASVSGTITLSASATAGAGSTLKNLSANLDGTLQLDSTSLSSFAIPWNTAAAGAGGHTLNVVATDADGGTTTASQPLTIAAGTPSDFTLSLSPASLTINPGSSGGLFTLTTAVKSGAAETIALSQSGLPAGLTALFSPASISAGQSATLTVSAPAGLGAIATTAFSVVGRSASVPSGHSAAASIAVATGPAVTITSPAANATLSSRVALGATVALDAGAKLSKVEFFDGSSSLGAATSSPASLTWDTTTAADGPHTLTVVATDQAGLKGSASLQVIVANYSSSDFTLALSPPAGGVPQGGSGSYSVAVGQVGGPLTVGLTVSGLASGLTAVLLDNAPASGSGTTLVISAAANAPLGTSPFTLTGSSLGGNLHSATSTVTVVQPGSQGSGIAVTLSSPRSGDTVSGVVAMSASASLPAGSTLLRIDFLVNGAVVGSSSSTPARYSWDTSALAADTYAVTAKAWDTAGNHGTSATAVVTVPSPSAPAAGCSSPGLSPLWSLAGLLALRRCARKAGSSGRH
jgi:Bacterial Ig domain